MADKIIIDNKIIEPIAVKPIAVKPIVGEVIKKIDDEVYVTTITKVDLAPLTDKKVYLQTIIDSIVPSDKELLEWAKQTHPYYDEIMRAEIELQGISEELKRYQ